MKRLALLLVVLFGVWSAYRAWLHRPYPQTPGTLVSEEPVQDDLDGSGPVFTRGDFTITAVAAYRIRARLLSREEYSADAGAKLSPLDFALGWGPMSDSAVIEKLAIHQGGRFYSYHWDHDPPVPADVIVRTSANTHLIPASSEVSDALDRMRAGQVIELQGYLVNVARADGWKWRSSLTRDDSGAGACELMWVEQARVIG